MMPASVRQHEVDSADRPVTVLQVLPALSSGGVERTTVDVAAALGRAGARALVASAGGPMVRELDRTGAEHVVLPLDSKSPWRIWRNRKVLADLIQAHGVDIVHARSRAPAWSALLAARDTGRPFVTTYHGTYNAQNRFKRWYNSVMARGDRVIANSAFIAEHVRERYGVGDDRLVVIPRGVDLVHFDPAAVGPPRLAALSQTWRLPDGVPVVLLPGRITRWKGHALLIEALARLGRRDLVCLFVGDDQARPRFRRELEVMIAQTGLAGQVRFVGTCRDMPAAYMLADVVVSASTDPEAFGRVAAEASAMGRPVVAADHGGARETVVDQRTGWLFQPRNADALAAAIDAALTLGTAERHALGLRARAHIDANFTIDRMCAATLGVYAELMAEVG